MSAAIAYCALRQVIEEHESSVAIHFPLIVLPSRCEQSIRPVWLSEYYSSSSNFVHYFVLFEILP
jgi:hypothetical protein